MTNSIQIASSDPLSTFYGQAELLGRVLADAGAITGAEVLTTTGSVINAEMTAAGQAEIGFMASNWVPRAVNGADPFKTPVGVAIIAPLNAGPLFFVARADSSLTSVRDLKGQAIAVGHATSGMAQHARNIVEGLGWGEGDYTFSYISTFDAGNALRDGTVAAQLSAPIPSIHFNELCARVAIKVLRFESDDIGELCRRHPFYSPALVPSEFVPGLDRDMPALGVLNVIVAAADAPEDFVYPLVRAFIANTRTLERGHPLFRGLSSLLARAREQGEAALAPGGAPLHPAARKAFQDTGLLA